MAEIEIGLGKTARRAFELDDISIVPSRRTRDPECVDLGWEIDAFRFELPLVAVPADSVVSPATAVTIGQLGGLAPLHLEGLWTRYDDPGAQLDEIATLAPGEPSSIERLQAIYGEPVKPELIAERIRQINGSGVVSCAAVSPKRAQELAKYVIDAELDVLIIQGTVVSAEHVSKIAEPLNLKTFVRELDLPVLVGGCFSYQAALHLMRTGAAGVIVGVGHGGGRAPRGTVDVLGIGAAHATAISDVQAARMRHLDETGVYVHVIANSHIRTGGDMAKAIACGADAVMLGAPLAAATEAPGQGRHWGIEATHPALPTGDLSAVPRAGALEHLLVGPSHESGGQLNLFGALRSSMATSGYESLKEFQKAEIVVRASSGPARGGG
ncbi:MAG: GuaB3 family IMP dehydrogenase-related protein [Actinobacteria bacterium]|nr:GuaB3 family IMP dehydrogenase-related protein [Actinomycetota bacterium]